VTQSTVWPKGSSEIWRRSSGPRSSPSYYKTGLPPNSRAGAARQKTSRQCDGHERWSNVPPREYRSKVFLPLTTQGLFLPPHYTYFTGSTFAIANFFPPWVRYTFFVCFVCRRHPSGGVSSIPSLLSGSTRLLTSFSFLLFFGLNHPYQSSLYRLNPNPPHHYIVISCSRFLPAKPLWRTAVSPIINSSPAHLPHHAILASFRHWHATYLSTVLGRTSAFRYSNFTLALSPASPSHPILLSSLCLLVPARNSIRILSA